MNIIISRKNVFSLLSLSAMAVLGSGLSAAAQTVEATSAQQSIQSSRTDAFVNQVSPEVESFYPPAFSSSAVESTAVQDNHLSSVSNVNNQQQLPTSTHQANNNVVTPVPGTTATSSAALIDSQNAEAQSSTSGSSKSKVAQSDISIDPGRPTRGGSSYIGIGGNIGLGGNSALGDGNFMVISKIGLTNAISVRPAAVIGDNTTILLPVTYDISFRQLSDPFAAPLPIAPYIGAGAAINTGDGSEVAFLVTGGVDVPITPRFTATAALNAAFFNETDIGLSIGVGYNFGRLFGS
ncbi:MAG: hypothetical protein KME49_00640 [Brasilonema octagenarum HA4186-MV1]|uniref:Outer membrane protein beta-barrel domain-containing protein n=1 Tax=Brasilonema sennae CENA114 TaxID=415709 RepID=A0A856MCG5_9CYAN|nr:hypothetical protein [Brasilonema sennae]MBW4624043.1 hypothetical protein [Brasilonema octagenarum HA4186-MV1]QDL08873.1 hypothetical protein DP114_14075 [Brasilonema sennae CENA114]QDL15230.1 hypothetical protein DP113_14015 [Brasilonema octagenarum UFV-E1]